MAMDAKQSRQTASKKQNLAEVHLYFAMAMGSATKTLLHPLYQSQVGYTARHY